MSNVEPSDGAQAPTHLHLDLRRRAPRGPTTPSTFYARFTPPLLSDDSDVGRPTTLDACGRATPGDGPPR